MDKNNNKENVIQFVPEKGVEAKINLQNFIRMSRNEISVFGKDLEWDSNTWELKSYLESTGKSGREVFSFVNFDTGDKKNGMVPMSQPYLDFAKACMCYGSGFNKNENHPQKLAAVRALEKILADDAVDDHERQERILKADMKTADSETTETEEN